MNKLLQILMGRFYAMHMADEAPAVIVNNSEGEEETAAEAAALATAQAETIVDTAKELAETIAKPDERHAELVAAVYALRTELEALRAENTLRHDEILREVREARTAAWQAEDAAIAAEVATEAATVAPAATEEIAAAATEVTEAAATVAETAANEPEQRKKKKRYFL